MLARVDEDDELVNTRGGDVGGGDLEVFHAAGVVGEGGAQVGGEAADLLWHQVAGLRRVETVHVGVRGGREGQGCRRAADKHGSGS